MLYTEFTVKNENNDVITKAIQGDLWGVAGRSLSKIEQFLNRETISFYSIIKIRVYDGDNMNTLAERSL